ncbi:hypothetical protein CEUSTIGMA_g7539.t1 [Chlamydomonas eustigma]|uniref:Polycystin cation channel PKD1/PKD2 domain-containing protein n=1 Tax=Chlamydomonas eustigma TaxID=1157962 RepID=A0A250XAI1_9CHLO|nr:hypothetical protein CEUSTIGMA_g7539.t1 [Chlamydomonas eustigma]|eukprot:GAX80101.1 hypothetical protein CEUSTIGMA_g7539.t1 [Chlamydomonas eustigma]
MSADPIRHEPELSKTPRLRSGDPIQEHGEVAKQSGALKVALNSREKVGEPLPSAVQEKEMGDASHSLNLIKPGHVTSSKLEPSGQEEENATLDSVYGHLIKENVDGCIELYLHHKQIMQQNQESNLMKLEKGCEIFKVRRSVHRTVLESELPSFLSECLWYIKGEIEDVDHLLGLGPHLTGRAKPGHFVRPIVLFPSQMRPAEWLRTGFVVMDEEEHSLKVQWGARSQLDYILTVLSGLTEVLKRQRLTIWYSRKVYGPGQKFVLPGAGSKGEITERPYIPAFLISRNEAQLRSMFLKWTNMSRHVPHEDYLNKHLQSVQTEVSSREVVIPQHKKSLLSRDRSEKTSYLQDSLQDLDPLSVFIVKTAYERSPLALSIIKDLLQSGKYIDNFKDPSVVSAVEQLAVNRNDSNLLMSLLSATPLEMSFKALSFLVHKWSLQLQQYSSEGDDVMSSTMKLEFNDVEQFLVKYMQARRNPMSIASAVIWAIDEEIRIHPEAERFIGPAVPRLHSLILQLLSQLLQMLYKRQLHIITLDGILFPSETETTVCDISPVKVAFKTSDYAFMNHELMLLHTERTWQGCHFRALTSCEDDKAISLRNPLFLHRILKLLGFEGGPLHMVLKFGMAVWHAYALCSLAFHNSPRGRWLTQFICELAFLTIYQVMVLYPHSDSSASEIIFVFLVFVVGNFVDMATFIIYKYGSFSGVIQYAGDPWHGLSLFTNTYLLVLSIFNAINQLESLSFIGGDEGTWLQLCICSAAPLVWLRALYILMPIYPNLGAMLITISRMLAAIVAFALPLIVVFVGFSTLFTGVYSESLDSYNSWTTSMLTMFKSMTGSSNFDDFSTNGFPEQLVLYGTLALVIFMILSSILLLNLLVAIIVARYEPQSTVSQSQYGQAELVDMYGTAVKHNYICSPLNLVQFLIFWIPNVPREPSGGRLARAFLMVNPDGESVADNVIFQHSGHGEFPHLVFLVVTYPLMATLAVVCFVISGPFAVWHFAHVQLEYFQKVWLSRNRVTPDQGAGEGDGSSMRRPWSEISLTFQKGKDEHSPTILHHLLQLPLWLLLMMIGGVLYWGMFGLCFLLIWTSGVWWIWKVLFSLYNFLVYPWIHKYVSHSKQAPHAVKGDTSNKSMQRGLDLEPGPPTPGSMRQISAVSEAVALSLDVTMALKKSDYGPMCKAWKLVGKEDEEDEEDDPQEKLSRQVALLQSQLSKMQGKIDALVIQQQGVQQRERKSNLHHEPEVPELSKGLTWKDGHVTAVLKEGAVAAKKTFQLPALKLPSTKTLDSGSSL